MRTKPGLKLVGLCALVTSVLAIGIAGVGQAENSACWGYRVNPQSALNCFSASLEAPLEIEVENNSGTHPSAVTLLVGNVNMEITCKLASVIEGLTLSANGSILLGRLQFALCFSRKTTAAGLELLPLCEPWDPVAGGGLIRTEKLTGLIVLHNGEPVVKLSPDNAQLILAKIHVEECPLTEEIVVTGHLVLQTRPLTIAGGDPENRTAKEMFETHATTHLFREFPGLQLMRVGGMPATLDGAINIKLGGAHFGWEWAGLPA